LAVASDKLAVGREVVVEVVVVANGVFRSERSGSSGYTGRRETVQQDFGDQVVRVMGQPSDQCIRTHNRFAVPRRTPAAAHDRVHPIRIIEQLSAQPKPQG